MLLSAEEWHAISAKPRHFHAQDKFIMTYVMSGRSDLMNHYIHYVKDRYGAQGAVNLDMEFIQSDKIKNIASCCIALQKRKSIEYLRRALLI